MRDYILLYLNGKRHCVRGTDAFLSLAEFLRERAGLTGVKIVCGEGACGACTVLAGTPAASDTTRLRFQTVNSCLHPVFQFDRTVLVTVEGVTGADGALSPVQQAMVAHHGTQCGYCTPGVVLSLTAACCASPTAAPTLPELRASLCGNLCRCTGYLPILQASADLTEADTALAAQQELTRRYPVPPELAEPVGEGVTLTDADGFPVLRQATTLPDALTFLSSYPNAGIVAGGTGMPLPPSPPGCPVLSIGTIPELAQIVLREDSLFLGAGVTWAQLGEAPETAALPALAGVVQRFGSPQLRHRGTVGGSVAQADPNGDWLPLLLVQEATVHLARWENNRVVDRQLPVATFFAEKCAPGELLTGITIPLSVADERLEVYKVRRRRAFDRSVFCAAVALRRDEAGNIATVRVACGGVGPVPMRLPRTEAFLQGAPCTEETMREAGVIAASEIAPVSDAYAGAEYRRQLAAGLLLRFFLEGAA